VRLQTEGLLKIEEQTKRPSKTSETNQKTIPNGWKNVVGTASAPKRAFEGGGRTPPEPRRTIVGSILVPEIQEDREKHHLKKHEKKCPPKMKNHAEKVSKWSRNDTKTNEHSIHKQVTGNIMKIIKNHVSLNGKIIEIHCKNKCF
jgi:hypothetical protein